MHYLREINNEPEEHDEKKRNFFRVYDESAFYKNMEVAPHFERRFKTTQYDDKYMYRTNSSVACARVSVNVLRIPC